MFKVEHEMDNNDPHMIIQISRLQSPRFWRCVCVCVFCDLLSLSGHGNWADADEHMIAAAHLLVNIT